MDISHYFDIVQTEQIVRFIAYELYCIVFTLIFVALIKFSFFSLHYQRPLIITFHQRTQLRLTFFDGLFKSGKL